jgi:Fic/DOC family
MFAIMCPEFEYDQHLGADGALKQAMMDFFRVLKNSADSKKLEDAKDTRAWHFCFFRTLTPRGFEYYAGHYRGEDFPCLRAYNVHISSDPLVAANPTEVPLFIMRLADKLHRSAALLDLETHRHANPLLSGAYVLKVIQVVAYFFVTFLTIHPYANGNGHMARLLVVLLLSRYGIHAPKFSVHPRPQDPPYSDAIYRYRRNDTKPLEMLLLGSLT